MSVVLYHLKIFRLRRAKFFCPGVTSLNDLVVKGVVTNGGREFSLNTFGPCDTVCWMVLLVTVRQLMEVNQLLQSLKSFGLGSLLKIQISMLITCNG